MKVLDLFSGIGGFSLGLERAGMETVAFCEFDQHARSVLKKHWPKVPCHTDIRELDATQYRGTVDVVCGGFPCQPHSFSGKRLASEDGRDLWGELFRVLCETGGWGLFENVRGLLTSEDGRYFGRILRDLAGIGYSCEWFVLPAGAVGAPHLRERIWIIAYPNKAQLERGCISKRVQQEYANTSYSRWGKDKSRVGRALDGLSGWMDRVRGLRLERTGNAVVPQIPELIGRAIMAVK